jgi:hypothetical protein
MKQYLLLLRLTIVLTVQAVTVSFVAAQTSSDPSSGTDPNQTEGSTAATSEETNVATTAMGANGLEVQGDAIGLASVLAEEDGASAQLVPAAAGAATTVIDLASSVTLTRVLLEVGETPGRLVIVGMSETGEQVDLSTEEGVSKLIADRKLDGSESIISLDVSQLTVKAVMIYWVPDEPGTPLTLNKVGIFTKDVVTPPSGDSIPVATVTPPPPIVPSPEVVQILVALVQESSQLQVPAGETTTTTTTTTEPVSQPLPEPIPPESRPTTT